MKIKTHRELAAFMAGIEAGRLFKLMDGGRTDQFVWFENFEDMTHVAVYFCDGSVYFENHSSDPIEPEDDIRHHALQGMLSNALIRAKESFKHYEATKADAKEKGNK